MNDEELDRELKRVQLMREKLALEKELKRKELKEKALRTAGRAPSMAVAASASIFAAIVQFLRRWWKIGLIGGAVLASLIWGFAIYSHMQEKKREAEQAEYWAQERPYIKKICEPYDCEYWNRSDVCHRQFIGYRECEAKAKYDFEVFWKAQRSGTFPPAPALAKARTVTPESPPIASVGSDGANENPYYAIASAAFSKLEDARLWRTRINQVPGVVPDHNVFVIETKAGWALLISEFRTQEDAERMTKKLAEVGIETEAFDRKTEFQFVF